MEDEEGNSLKNVAELIVAKHRNGATDTIKMKFIAQYAKFTNLEDPNFSGFVDEDYEKSNQANSNIITLGSRMNDDDIPF